MEEGGRLVSALAGRRRSYAGEDVFCAQRRRRPQEEREEKQRF